MLLLPHKRRIGSVKNFLPPETVKRYKNNILRFLFGLTEQGN
jgi:hypothetical protein